MNTETIEREVTYEQAAKIFDLPKDAHFQKYVIRLIPKEFEPFESSADVLNWSEEMANELW